MLRRSVLAGAMVLLSVFSWAKDAPIKLSTITDTAEPSGVEVMKFFRQKIGSHENLFKLVDNTDPSLGLLFQEDCMPRQATEPRNRSSASPGNGYLRTVPLNLRRLANRDFSTCALCCGLFSISRCL